MKDETGTRVSYLIRKSARATNQKDAGSAESEHKRALRLGEIHPLDPWPKPKPQTPQIPTLREFTKQFLAYVEVQKKAGTKRFYEVCSNSVLRFAPMADAVLTDITGEVIGKYAQWRRSTAANDSVLSINGGIANTSQVVAFGSLGGSRPASSG